MADLFAPATPAEVSARRRSWIQDWDRQMEAFRNREDVFQRGDGSFDVRGNVEDLGSKDFNRFRRLALRYATVLGDFSCNGSFRSLMGAPRIICGNFRFHGDLKSLMGFPKEVWGNIELINHPHHKDEQDAIRWTEADIRNICDVRGTLTVENHSGI